MLKFPYLINKFLNHFAKNDVSERIQNPFTNNKITAFSNIFLSLLFNKNPKRGLTDFLRPGSGRRFLSKNGRQW